MAARFFLLALLWPSAEVAAQEERAPARPNFVFILADDLGYGELGCYGQQKIETPHIDRLAADGLRFTQHYSGAPVCAPARCVFMTGLHSGHAFVRGNRGAPGIGQLPLPAGTATLPGLLREAGYRTCFVGKWGLGGPGTTGLPDRQGFDHWFGYLDQWNAHTHYPAFLWRNGKRVVLEGNRDGKQQQYAQDLITEEALDFLRKQDPDQPFFLYVAVTIPHVSLHVPAASLRQYEGRWPETPYAGGHYAGHATPRAAYAAMISHMDRDVGRLVALLKERGLDDRTIVFFSSDNGPTYAGGADAEFFESTGPLRGLKGSLYEGGIRVPLIARWPGYIRAGATTDHVSAFEDILPTLLDLAGAKTPPGLDGLSFKPTLLGEGEQPRRAHLYWEHPEGNWWQAVRAGRWKAVRKNIKGGNRKLELYDLETDVGEKNDVAKDHPEAAQRLAALMAKSRTPSDHFPLRLPVGFVAGRNRTWIGPRFWANRLQDWRLHNGRAECLSEAPLRTLHCLTHRPEPNRRFRLRVRTGIEGGAGAVGFLLGAGGDIDYRAAALVHGVPGKGGGLLAGIDARGDVFLRANDAPRARPPDARLPRKGWAITADSEEPTDPAAHAIDGDPATKWHSEWRRRKPDHPHRLVVDLGITTRFNGFAYLARRTNAPGRIERFSFSVSDDGKDWRRAAAGSFASRGGLQEVWFEAQRARFVRLETLSAHHGRPVAAVAELYLLDGPPRPTGRAPDDVLLELEATPLGNARVRLRLRAYAFFTLESRGEATLDVDAAQLAGNVALASDGTRSWFRDLRIDGARGHPDRTLGPVVGTQYTLSRGVLKLTAQLMPVGPRAPPTATLQAGRGEMRVAARAPVVRPGFTATFRVENWDATRDTPFRVVYDGGAWEGTIRREPATERSLVLAALSCNHNNSHRIGRAPFDWTTGIWFPHADLTARLAAHDPDLLFFAGDQIYEGRSPTPADRAHLELDYLYKWLLWCWAYRDLTRDRPCVTIPDDHDVFQGNLWGEGGRKAARDNEGGYVHPPAFVRMVERTQTSHLPDPFDPAPVAQEIGVYYTDLLYGGVSFAILEDRKFKSGCAGRLPPTGTKRPDHIADPDFDVAKADVAGLTLLGDRQLRFLEQWSRDWQGAAMKVALSQTPFANLATHHGAGLERLRADLDSNGWPQSGRARALRALRRAFALHVCGDQHLATLAHHGLDRFGDGPWSFCVPSIANFYPRQWLPEADGGNRPAGAPPWLGDHRDGFGNRVTMHAVANPKPTGRAPRDLHDGMPGYGIVRLDKEARTITMECWPRYALPGEDAQYEGWPKTVGQTEVKAAAFLPQLTVRGATDPVVQVVDEANGEVVYTLRIRGTTFRPPLFSSVRRKYTVRVSDGARERVVTGVEASGTPIRVDF